MSKCLHCGEEIVRYAVGIMPKFCLKSDCQKEKNRRRIEKQKEYNKNYRVEAPMIVECRKKPNISGYYYQLLQKDKKKNWSEWTPKHI